MATEPTLIGDLKGVGSTTAARLLEAGFTSVESIAITPMKELMEKTGISDDTATSLLQKVRDFMGLEFITALELFDKRQKAQRLTTGSKNLDDLLGGGIETQAITEFIGEYGTGKSQICMQLCITSQQPPEQGGLGGKVLFIDTEGTFSPQRISDNSKLRGFDPTIILENIIYARCYNSDHQMLLVDKAGKVVEEEKIKMIVVDSLISHFRGEYVGREMLSERQQKLNKHIHKLLRLAELYNCAVVITNQIQANPTAFFGDPNRPAGGNVLAHASTHRLYIRKGRKNTRIIHVIDSPYLPENETRFAITAKGVEDAEEK
ncbi:MAG: DNA repair and recombination protein RadA [Candidatus Bathyarchaeota archaeon]